MVLESQTNILQFFGFSIQLCCYSAILNLYASWKICSGLVAKNCTVLPPICQTKINNKTQCYKKRLGCYSYPEFPFIIVSYTCIPRYTHVGAFKCTASDAVFPQIWVVSWVKMIPIVNPFVVPKLGGRHHAASWTFISAQHTIGPCPKPRMTAQQLILYSRNRLFIVMDRPGDKAQSRPSIRGFLMQRQTRLRYPAINNLCVAARHMLFALR